MLEYALVPTPVGELAVAWGGEGIKRIWFVEAEGAPIVPAAWSRRSTAAFGASEQLTSYLSGNRRGFDFPLVLRGTDFQMSVWSELQKIPYGTTFSYGQIATALGQPGASRAVGGANNKNPIPVVVPCHRVVAANGAFGGYAGGVQFKRFLLDHELRHSFGET
mgnify:FL=1